MVPSSPAELGGGRSPAGAGGGCPPTQKHKPACLRAPHWLPALPCLRRGAGSLHTHQLSQKRDHSWQVKPWRGILKGGSAARPAQDLLPRYPIKGMTAGGRRDGSVCHRGWGGSGPGRRSLGIWVGASPREQCCAGSLELGVDGRGDAWEGDGPERMEPLRATSHLLAGETEAQSDRVPGRCKLGLLCGW